MDDASLPPCPTWDPLGWFNDCSPTDEPPPVGTGGGGAINPTAICPPGWVCQTAEAHDKQQSDERTKLYVYAGGAAVLGILGGVLIGGWAQK